MDVMNIYEIADRLLDLALTLDDKEDKDLVIRASCMLSNIEGIVTDDYADSRLREVLLNTIYPLQNPSVN